MIRAPGWHRQRAYNTASFADIGYGRRLPGVRLFAALVVYKNRTNSVLLLYAMDRQKFDFYSEQYLFLHK